MVSGRFAYLSVPQWSPSREAPYMQVRVRFLVGFENIGLSQSICTNFCIDNQVYSLADMTVESRASC
jgi:hypothetical protein